MVQDAQGRLRRCPRAADRRHAADRQPAELHRENSTISMMPSQKRRRCEKNMAAIETSVSHTVRTLTEATTQWPRRRRARARCLTSEQRRRWCTEIA